MGRLNFSRTQLLILISVWLTFLISFVVRLSWSSVMPIVNEALNFTPQMGTSYLSAFYLGYALAVLPGGILADRIGYRKTILFSLLSMSIVTALMSTIDSYTYGWVLRFLLGIASGPVQASCLSALGDHFGPNQRGAAVGIFMSCTSFGITTVNLYAPVVATYYGWQMAFLVTAALPLLVLLLSYFTVRKPSAEVLAQRALEDGGVDLTEKPSLKDNLRHILQNRNIKFLAIAGFFATGTTWGVTQWANLYMVKQLGVTAIYAGQVMSAFGTAALIAKPTIGILSDLLPIKKNHLAALVMFLFAPALILFASTTNVDMLFIVGPILGVGAFMHSALTNALVVQSAEPRLRGTTAGFVNLFNQIGVMLAPMLLSQVLTFTGNYQYALMSIAVAPVLGAIALFFVRLRKD
ncbi:MFS transporter [Veillonella agrestimuris]|uniref:MFS transporter n=1 Tax=Veillonella agrestimuris TaxID=2941340 RepID=UPI00203A7BB8|nr:MFS transporter [Veillonella agrestimuris]